MISVNVSVWSRLLFAPAVFSHAGQIYGVFKRLVKEQIRQKLICFEGQAKRSEIRSAMKWRSKRATLPFRNTASGTGDQV